MPLAKTSGVESADNTPTSRWAWLVALYLINLAILGVVCLALMHYRVFNSLRHPWLCWLIGLADAEVALGAILMTLGPGPYSIRIPLGIVLTGMGIIANGVVNRVDVQATTDTIVQIMFASVIHTMILVTSAWLICRRRTIAFTPRLAPDISQVPWHVPVEAYVFDFNEAPPQKEVPPQHNEQQPAPEPPVSLPRFGIGHVLLATTAIAMVLALIRTFLPEIDWNTVDWLAATRLSPFLWFDIAILCILPLGVVVVGLWEEGQAQLVVATFAGIATCAVQVALLSLFTGALPAEMMIAVDFSRLLILLANASALRVLGVSLQR